MRTVDKKAHDFYNSPGRTVKAEVAWGPNEKLTFLTFKPETTLVKFTIENTIPKGKFFGYIVSQKLTLEVLGNYGFTRGDVLRPKFTHAHTDEINEDIDLTWFKIDDIETDVATRTTTITAYDFISDVKNTSLSTVDYALGEGTKVMTYIKDLANLFGFTVVFDWFNPEATDLNIDIAEETVNFNPENTTFYDVLNWAAELLGAIVFCSQKNEIHFKRNTQLVYGYEDEDEKHMALTPNNYYDYSSSELYYLTHLRLTTPLGDNIETGKPEAHGECIQTIADNPFMTLRDDKAWILEQLLIVLFDVQLTPFSIECRGNPYYELGDYIVVYKPDGSHEVIRWLNSSMTFDGGLRCTAFGEMEQQEDVHANSVNLGQQLKNTVAKVDKVNNEITLIASKADANAEAISAINMNVDSINASVTRVEQGTVDAINGVTDEIATLTNKVEAVMTSEALDIKIQEAINKGADSVTTSTGFTFNSDGLNISKTGSEMTTNIDEDGMSVFRNDTEVLTADNAGVIAYNLRAKTYLIIGERSRFEDYTNTNGEARTGCFWIGG